jgi:hypothetical protein
MQHYEKLHKCCIIFQNAVVTTCSTYFDTKILYTLPIEYIFGFCIILIINNNNMPNRTFVRSVLVMEFQCIVTRRLRAGTVERTDAAINILLQCSTSYLCEQAFSCLTSIKSKDRNRLISVEDELRVCLSKVQPRIKYLCSKKQGQVSH